MVTSKTLNLVAKPTTGMGSETKVTIQTFHLHQHSGSEYPLVLPHPTGA